MLAAHSGSTGGSPSNSRYGSNLLFFSPISASMTVFAQNLR